MLARWPLLLSLSLLACGPSTAPVTPAPAPRVSAAAIAPAPVPATQRPIPIAPAAAVTARADAIHARAAAVEPSVTLELIELAKSLDGEMIKLEHRLKTKASIERKLSSRMLEKGKTLGDVVIDDALRYTMRIDDRPPGRYVEGVEKTLAALEAAGHRVIRLKNYWPTDDNYSGINCVLETPDGLLWELQFHTAASLEAQHETRDMYEELRLDTTPVARKRELFDAMTAIWAKVPIPVGVLGEAPLHPRAERIDRPRP
ncbi:MAG: hypothetical protein R3B72_04845 [Polyangiaceae bacterium]